MSLANLHDAEMALEQISNLLYAQLKNCTPYQPSGEDYLRFKNDPTDSIQGGDIGQKVRRHAAKELANSYGFVDENLMVIARDFIIQARNCADDYCERLQSILEAETHKEFGGILGKLKLLRSKADPAVKKAADAKIQEIVSCRKKHLYAEFDDDLGKLYQDTLALLRDTYGRGC